MEFVQIKKRAALLSIGSNTILILAKLIVGLITGSVSIISETVHSLTDLLGSCITFFSVKASSEPADIEHQFGHGKFEDLSGLIEGILILLAAVFIIYEAVYRITNGLNVPIATTAGIMVMFVSAVANIFVSKYLLKIAHKTESIALLADAEHLRTHIFTSCGVLSGLIAIRLTGITIIDPAIAIFVALFIIKTGVSLCWKAGRNLLDASLPEEERIIIREIVRNYTPEQVVDIQSIKTRKSGAQRLIEFTLTVPESMTIREGHDLCDRIEEDLKKDMGNVSVTIHLGHPAGFAQNAVFFTKIIWLAGN